MKIAMVMMQPNITTNVYKGEISQKVDSPTQSITVHEHYINY